MKKVMKFVCVCVATVLMASVYVVPAAAAQRGGQDRKAEGKAQETVYLDAEVRVIDGQPVLVFEGQGNERSEHPFPWPQTAIVDGREAPLQREGNYFLLPAEGEVERVSIEDFDVTFQDGQIMLSAQVNPKFLIPVGAAGILLKIGVPVTTLNMVALGVAMRAGLPLTARNVTAVARTIVALGTGLTAAAAEALQWAIGRCVDPLCTAWTPDGRTGDWFCTPCSRHWGQRTGPDLW